MAAWLAEAEAAGVQVSLATIAFANALVVLGLVILWRAGLVPFGQALYYCTGAYTVALLGRWAGANDAILMVLLGGVIARVLALALVRAVSPPSVRFEDASPPTAFSNSDSFSTLQSPA